MGDKESKGRRRVGESLYDYSDQSQLIAKGETRAQSGVALSSLDELLERDRMRELDGFPRKIRIGRLVKPGKGGEGSVVIVPTTVEEKLIHDSSFSVSEEGEAGGTGEGQEGEVIGEQPVHEPEGEGAGPGEGAGGAHEIESSAYDLGRILTEKFELPNLKDKGKKRALSSYSYEMSDRNRGFGQILDKKETLRQVIRTNIALGRISRDGNEGCIDPQDLLVSPSDRVYRILSRERDYESQAMVFFMRDYSGSMAGRCTEVVVSQHVLIYAWLTYQYANRLETRFILHDVEAKEVPDFHSYYSSAVAGGTEVSSGYQLINELVEAESLAGDYNIYVFQGSDGDDWDTDGKKAVPELKKMLFYANRVGITIVKHSYSGTSKTAVENYLQASRLLEEQRDLIQLDALMEDVSESRLIEGIKKLTAQNVSSNLPGFRRPKWN